jgi:hypothetical protein
VTNSNQNSVQSNSVIINNLQSSLHQEIFHFVKNKTEYAKELKSLQEKEDLEVSELIERKVSYLVTKSLLGLVIAVRITIYNIIIINIINIIKA